MFLIGAVLCFIIGYIAIVFEHPLKIDKTVPALIMGALAWALVSLGHLPLVNAEHIIGSQDSILLHHIGRIAEILLFLIGAMVIVELIDLHGGFSVITNRITATNKFQMLLIICVLGFFLSAVLDNLTCTIVLVSLLRKLVPQREERIWFVSFAVIAANAGGAWSPIGDVTTTMLWIGGKVSAGELVIKLFIPSLLCTLAPIAIASQMKAFKGNITPADYDANAVKQKEDIMGSKTILAVGVGGLIFVPIFKTITHLPPYIGMMLVLGVIWLISELIHRDEEFDKKEMYTAHHALSRIEMSSILFFLGILVTIAALESIDTSGHAVGEHGTGLLMSMAEQLRVAIPNTNIVIVLLGILSAVIDNVPLVAASMGMYTEPMDDSIWHFIAYSAGTGGSMLIIGSAAGVAAMGMEKIDFIWYFKNITGLAALGFLAGCAAYIGIAMM
jgi:Na+/H+ antiporter NhaD/arsenite permease-like protein